VHEELSQVLEFPYLTKSPENVLAVEFSCLKIAGTAERDCTGMTEYLPKPLCGLNCCRRACALRRLASNVPAVNKIKRQCNEAGCFAHVLQPLWSGRLLESENTGDQVAGLGVRDHQIRHLLVI
jgi:tRNA G26 N,N-dimethylase Trm1